MVSELLQIEIEAADSALAAVEMQKKITERLNGLVLVHYFDEAVPAALVLQKNAREFLNRKRARTDSPEKGRDGEVMLDHQVGLEAAQLGFSLDGLGGEVGGGLGGFGEEDEAEAGGKGPEEAATLLQAQYRGQQAKPLFRHPSRALTPA